MADQDIKMFYEFVTAELMNIKDRVRNLIGNVH